MLPPHRRPGADQVSQPTVTRSLPMLPPRKIDFEPIKTSATLSLAPPVPPAKHSQVHATPRKSVLEWDEKPSKKSKKSKKKRVSLTKIAGTAPLRDAKAAELKKEFKGPMGLRKKPAEFFLRKNRQNVSTKREKQYEADMRLQNGSARDMVAAVVSQPPEKLTNQLPQSPRERFGSAPVIEQSELGERKGSMLLSAMKLFTTKRKTQLPKRSTKTFAGNIDKSEKRPIENLSKRELKDIMVSFLQLYGDVDPRVQVRKYSTTKSQVKDAKARAVNLLKSHRWEISELDGTLDLMHGKTLTEFYRDIKEAAAEKVRLHNSKQTKFDFSDVLAKSSVSI